MGINELPGTKYEIARRNRPSCLVSPFSLSRGSDPIPGDDFVRHHIFWDVFLGDISFYLVLEFVSSFSSRSYPPVRKRTDYCHMNMSTNMALKIRTRCYSFDQSVRKCDDRLVVNMMNKNYIIFPNSVVSTVLLLLCVKHHAHRNSKSKVYPLRCQDSGPPTRSYTAAAASAAVRCCCCCGLGTRTHTRTVPLTSGWRVYIHTTSRDTPSSLGCPASRPWHLPSHSDRAQTLRNTASYILLKRGFTATPARCWAALYGVGCLSVRAAKAVSLCVSRAPPLGMFVSCLGKRRDHSGRYRQ